MAVPIDTTRKGFIALTRNDVDYVMRTTTPVYGNHNGGWQHLDDGDLDDFFGGPDDDVRLQGFFTDEVADQHDGAKVLCVVVAHGFADCSPTMAMFEPTKEHDDED